MLVSGGSRRREDLPPFLLPPEGTMEHEQEQRQRQGQQQRGARDQPNPHHGETQLWNKFYSCSGNPNINHSGPPSTGKPMENFVIMLKPNENAVCILNTSAQVSVVDYLMDLDIPPVL